MLMLVLGTALMLTTMTETRIAASYRDGTEAFYAAEAAIDRAMQDLSMAQDWNDLLAGALTSSFVDGRPGGTRTLADGAMIDLTSERPSDGDNRRWRLYAYGPLADLLPAGRINSRMYVVVWVAEDPPGNDGNHAVLALRAHAYGPQGVRRAVEVTVGRTGSIDPVAGRQAIRRLSWREGS